MHSRNILQMDKIDKKFSGVRALDQVDFFVRQGEIHGLLGENGAGKSTLMKILTGVYSKDGGTVTFGEKSIDPANVAEAQREGIVAIYQEITLIPQMNAVENIFLGRELKKNKRIDFAAEKKKTLEVLEQLGIKIDVMKPVREYGVAIQQTITIARAISMEAKLLIMDESTSSLSDEEVESLFQTMKQLKKTGMSIIFISHKLSEIFRICDSVTILKDGKLEGRYETSELTMHSLVMKMAGREVKAERYTDDTCVKLSERPMFEAKNITSGNRVKNVSLSINEGEIVGLAGLLGAGRTEFALAVFGAAAKEQGNIFVDGREVKIRRPKDAIENGVAYLPENRRSDGILPRMSICENLCIASKDFSRFGVLSQKQQSEVTEKYIKSISIKTPGQNQLIKNLSGGNQQKVLLARWLCLHPKLVILDEPTRGIDIGAKQEIEQLIREMAKEGMGILYISSEIDELVRNCNRVYILYEGENKCVLSGEDITQDNILKEIAK